MTDLFMGDLAAFNKALEDNTPYNHEFYTKNKACLLNFVSYYESCKASGQPDELTEDFDNEQSRKALTDDARALLKEPLIQSLLYDLNLLPEQITKYKHWYYMLAVISHMGDAMKAPKREVSNYDR